MAQMSKASFNSSWPTMAVKGKLVRAGASAVALGEATGLSAFFGFTEALSTRGALSGNVILTSLQTLS